jgi:hypothetical protein
MQTKSILPPAVIAEMEGGGGALEELFADLEPALAAQVEENK